MRGAFFVLYHRRPQVIPTATRGAWSCQVAATAGRQLPADNRPTTGGADVQPKLGGILLSACAQLDRAQYHLLRLTERERWACAESTTCDSSETRSPFKFKSANFIEISYFTPIAFKLLARVPFARPHMALDVAGALSRLASTQGAPSSGPSAPFVLRSAGASGSGSA